MLLIVLLAPTITYGVFELSSLTADEQELEKIYERQLEAVLFSLNQYTQDVVGGIATKMDNAFQHGSEGEIEAILQPYKFFRALDVRDVDGTEDRWYGLADNTISGGFRQLSDSVYKNSDLVNRLVRYKSNYQKIEPGTSSVWADNEELDIFQFVIGTENNYRFCTYYFSGTQFIEQILGPKIQEVSRGEFIILCRNKVSEAVIYSNIDLKGDKPDVRSEVIDLLPQYEIGISRTGSSIQQAVAKRKEQNLIALGLLFLFLILGMMLVLRNIRKELELAQNKADFVSNVSHEIRTPLALINMFAETLLLDRVKGEQKKKEYYEIITKEVGRLTNMINRILSFSKIEANKREYNKEQQCLNEITQEVLNTYSYHLENQGFKYRFIPSEQMPEVMADREALIEVMVNLIDNAMKYSNEVKEVELSTGVQGNMAYVAVKDCGIGIPKGQLEKLFEKFYRVHTGDVHDAKGSGLGLTIVKHIMDAHNGKIQVQSTPGEGSTFTILFPIYNQ